MAKINEQVKAGGILLGIYAFIKFLTYIIK